MSESISSSFKNGIWNELKRSVFLLVKYHKSENLIFQHLHVKEKTNNSHQNNILEEIKRLRDGIIVDTLTSVDIVEILKRGGSFVEVYEGVLWSNLENNSSRKSSSYREFATDTFEKRDIFKSEWKDLLQNLPEKIALSEYGGKIRKYLSEESKCVTESWMNEKF